MTESNSDFFIEAWFESQAEHQLPTQSNYDSGSGMTHLPLTSQIQILSSTGLSPLVIPKTESYDRDFAQQRLGRSQVSPTLANCPSLSTCNSPSSSSADSSKVSPSTSFSSSSTIDPYLLALSGSSSIPRLQSPPVECPTLFPNQGAQSFPLTTRAFVEMPVQSPVRRELPDADAKSSSHKKELEPNTVTKPSSSSSSGPGSSPKDGGPAKKFISPRRREMHNKSATRSRSRLNATIEKMYTSIPEGYRRQLHSITLSESKYKKQLSRADKSEIVIGYMRYLEGQLERERVGRL